MTHEERYVRNLQALAIRHPELAARVPRQVTVPEYQIAPVPPQEAARMLNEVGINDGGVIVVLSLRDGQMVRQLVNNMRVGTRVLIYEHSMERFIWSLVMLDLSEVFRHSSVSMIVRDVDQLIHHCETAITKTSLHLRVVRQFGHTSGDERQALLDLAAGPLNDFLVQQPVRHATLDTLGHEFIENYLASLIPMASAQSFLELRHRGKERPALVLGSGPSLDAGMPWVVKHRASFTIIAADSALLPLQEAGIQPDLVTTVDPQQDTARKLKKITSTKDIGLVFHPFACPDVINPWEGPRFTCDVALPLHRYFMDGWLPPKGAGLDWLCHCQVHMGYNVAHLLGAHDIILLGVDMCFPDYRMHTDHSYMNREEERLTLDRCAHQTTINARGEELKTSSLFLSYLQLWTRRIRERPPTGKVYNLTDRGIAIAGADTVFIEHAETLTECFTDTGAPFRLPPSTQRPRIDYTMLKERRLHFLEEIERMIPLCERINEVLTPIVDQHLGVDMPKLSSIAEGLMYELSKPTVLYDALTTSDTLLTRSVFGDVSVKLDTHHDPSKRLEGQALRAHTAANTFKKHCETYREILTKPQFESLSEAAA